MAYKSSLLAVIEVGTTRTVCMAGSVSADLQVDIAGIGFAETTGMRKGEVTDLRYAVASVKRAAKEVFSEWQCDIRTASVIVSGGGAATQYSPGKVMIPERLGEVDAHSINEAKALARSGEIAEDRVVLHNIIQNYIIDDCTPVTNPEGLPAKSLLVNTLRVHASEQSLGAVMNVIEEAQIEPENTVFSALCAGLATLTPEQKKAGVLLINMGGGTTTYLVYADEAIAAAGSFALGGDHITNDILQAFHLTSHKTAEWMKINHGSAILDKTNATDRVSTPSNSLVGSGERTFSLRAINTVIHARLDETFKILRGSLDSHGLLSKLGAGVVLTGGVAYQRGICTLASRIFETPCVIGSIPGLAGIEGVRQPASLAAAYGGLILAERRRLELEDQSSRGFLKWFRKGLRNE